ncbi:MAG: glycosyltransferase family 2 protein [Candidatus Moraniibacteriota bacterium]|nr:MAG: glycosyltransferase family 2 protein [Candidatus Moranbacteria bacterium]
MRTFSVTVGIAAYNEEANIAFLLEDVLKQRCDSFVLDKIVVISDGSLDETAVIAKRYESSGVCVFDDGQRKGKSERLNEVFNMSQDSDAVILLDADIVLLDDSVFETMIRCIREGADLVSPELRALPPRNAFGYAIVAGHKLKCDMFSEWNSGNNIYQCHGAARAFSRRFFEKFRFRESVGEDAYSYLLVKKFGFRYTSTRDAAIAIRVPESLRDHENQSRRFLSSQSLFRDEYGADAVLAEYRYPKTLLAKHLTLSFLKRPLAVSWYVCIMAYISLFSPKSDVSQTWTVASSSKNVR